MKAKNHNPHEEFDAHDGLYAIVPASAIILLIAIRKILASVKFNEEIFGEIYPDEIDNSASVTSKEEAVEN